MARKKKPQRGGVREGAGRPPADPQAGARVQFPTCRTDQATIDAFRAAAVRHGGIGQLLDAIAGAGQFP